MEFNSSEFEFRSPATINGGFNRENPKKEKWRSLVLDG
jgi:hypothetical protein